MKHILFIIFTILIFVANAQQSFDFKPLKSQGTIPEILTRSSYEKYKSDLERINKGDSKFERKTQDDFLLQSTFYSDMFLRSGRILFGDPVTIYINKVADVVLSDFPELRKQVQFFTLRSEIVNAFSMDNGVILISTGLISKLNNESELAFIIGHELIHYTKKHAISQYVENKKISTGKGDYKELTYKDKLFASLHYSKEDEFTADKGSIETFLSRTKYSLAGLASVFKMLEFHNLPFEDIPFETNYISPLYHELSMDYWLEAVDPPRSSDEDSEYSTHPNLKLRTLMIEDVIKNSGSDDGKSTYIVSEEEFMHVRNLCRFENINTLILGNELPQAFYNVFLLEKQFPDNMYLEKAKAYILYSISVYKNNNNINEVTLSYKRTSGYWQQLFYFFRRVNKAEMNCIALNKCWQIKQKYPDDKLLKDICTGLIEGLVYDNKLELSSFLTEVPVADTTAQIETDNKALKGVKQSKNILIEKTLIEIMSDKDFTRLYSIIYEEKLMRERESKFEITSRKKGESKKGFDIDTLLVYEPNITVYLQKNRRTTINHIDSESASSAFSDIMHITSAMHQMQLYILDVRSMNNEDIDNYNDFETVKIWIANSFDNSNTLKVNWMQEEIQEVINKNNTKYLYYPYISTVKQKRIKGGPILILLITLPPVVPVYILFKAIVPSYKTSYLGALINLETGEIEEITYMEYASKLNGSWIKAITYDDFRTYNRKKQ